MTNPRMSRRRVSRLLPIILAASVTACIDDAPTAVNGHGQVNLAISAQVVGTGSELVEIGVSYLRSDGALVRLPVSPDSVRLTTGTTIQQPATVDVTACLSDPASVVQGGCQLSVQLRLLDSTGVLMDSATFEPSGPSLPGQTVTMPTVSLAGCGPMVPEPAGQLIAPFVPTPGSLISLNANTPTSVQFVNGSCEDVTISWIDYDGGAVQYATLAPGQSHSQPTFLTHLWLVADAKGRSTLFMPAPAPGVAYIPRSQGIASTVPVATLTLVTSSDTTPLPVGQSRVFTAAPKDAQRNVLIGRTVTWTAPGLPAPITMTSTASGATFTATGTQIGTVTITATSEGVSISTTILVAAQTQTAPADLTGIWDVTQSFTGAGTTNPNLTPSFFGTYRWQLTQTGNQVTGQVFAVSGAAGDGTFVGTYANGVLTGTLKLARDPVAYRLLQVTFTANTGTGTAEYSGPQPAYQNGAVADYYNLSFSPGIP